MISILKKKIITSSIHAIQQPHQQYTVSAELVILSTQGVMLGIGAYKGLCKAGTTLSLSQAYS